jgi:primosomal protein N' (replication factor Y)
MLKRIFPEAIINCWDSRTKDSQIVLASAKILSALYGEERFDNGFFLEADDELSRLDYEAELNTYAYINKLASLFSECLYVFTRNSQQYFFKALNTDWQDFYKNELRIRKELRLPPFITLAKITLRALSEDKVYKQANEFYNLIKSKDFETYGPFKEQPFKLRKKFRYSIVIKSEDGYYLRKTIKELVQKIRTSSLKIAVIIM